MLCQLSPVGGGRGHLISSQREHLDSVGGGRDAFVFYRLHWSAEVKTVRLLSSPFCVDGYYKLTGINGCWLEHYFTRQRQVFQIVSWLEMCQVLEVFLIHFITHLNSLRFDHLSKIKCTITMNNCVSVLVWTGHAEVDHWSTWYRLTGQVGWGGGVLPDNVPDLYHIPSAVHLIFHPSHLFMNVCLRVSECVVSVVYLFCL